MSRAISTCRTRSPFSRQASPRPVSQSASPTPRQDLSHQNSTNLEPINPSRIGYQVYNDTVSPELQPQTPAHLPESRHQSRYHPSYTAPVTRAAARRTQNVDSVDGEGLQQSLPRQRQVPLYTPLRGGRSASPIGLVQGGSSQSSPMLTRESDLRQHICIPNHAGKTPAPSIGLQFVFLCTIQRLVWRTGEFQMLV